MIKLNNKEVAFGSFPNQECNLPLGDLLILEESEVRWDYEDDSEFFKVALIKSHLDNLNCSTSLYLGYMPYSRMDRVNPHYAMSLMAASKMINSLSFDRVIIREPHSLQTLGLVTGSEAHWWVQSNLSSVIEASEANSLYFPDDGAVSRYKSGMPYAVGKKRRDFSTGRIVSYEAEGDVLSRVLIVDDLCSRGGTFVAAAKELQALGAISISLLVCHCEDNVFTGDIFDWVDHIYTSPGMLTKDHPRITKI